MEFRTVVEVPSPSFQIDACESLLFVGSCFADAIGQRFLEEKFRAVVNPYGVMYNPASILHTVQRLVADSADLKSVKTAFLTLGTNHVYRLKDTGEIGRRSFRKKNSLSMHVPTICNRPSICFMPRILRCMSS